MRDLAFNLVTADDTEVLLGLMREYYDFDHLEFVEERARTAIGMLHVLPDAGKGWFISVDGILAGYCVLGSMFSLEFNGRTALIDELYLRPAYRNLGLGGRVVEFLVAECRSLGFQAVRLEVELENEHARRVYERHHFAAHHRALMTRWLTD